MIKLKWLLGLALLLTACVEPRKEKTTAYDPCRQMKEEGKAVRDLEKQMKALEAKAETLSGRAAPDTGERVTLDSLIAQKEDILASAKESMQQSAEDCDARSRPFDRYRTPPEREDNL